MFNSFRAIVCLALACAPFLFMTTLANGQESGVEASLMQQRCSRGEALACASLGNSEIQDGNFPEGRKYLEIACSKGHLDSCLSVGVLLKARGDLPGALGNLKAGCEAGSAMSCQTMGTFLEETGKNAEAQDAHNKGARIFKSACEKGAEGQELCSRLEFSKHNTDAFPETKTSVAVPAPKETKAADGMKSEDVRKLPAEYIAGLKAQCSKGDGQSCRRFGVILLVQQQVNEAKIMFETSCKLEDGGGCVKLALLADEQGQKQDSKRYYLRARAFYLKGSCKEGIKEACKKFENLQAELLAPPARPMPLKSAPAKVKPTKAR